MLDKLISGGQTGVDRAALDVGLALGLAVGGWCPKGRRAEDGPIPDRYPLVETPERNDPARTRCKNADADRNRRRWMPRHDRYPERGPSGRPSRHPAGSKRERHCRCSCVAGG